MNDVPYWHRDSEWNKLKVRAESDGIVVFGAL